MVHVPVLLECRCCDSILFLAEIVFPLLLGMIMIMAGFELKEIK